MSPHLFLPLRVFALRLIHCARCNYSLQGLTRLEHQLIIMVESEGFAKQPCAGPAPQSSRQWMIELFVGT
ncbi:hypothetical protein MPL3356_160111 [Mesorhizobium plurifarium]|uniref:Uncharacterized protein n=1 Tax=Mesorhizobium plurifarium TaxID=69974 RepID=A0A090F659_MESPL|nr:hypothetical protein MPL3356_160111 [Mesorhizobium plurifarium]